MPGLDSVRVVVPCGGSGMPPAVNELALDCAPKTPLFLAVRLLNRKKKSRASARFHPRAAAKKGDLQITNTSPLLNLARTSFFLAIASSKPPVSTTSARPPGCRSWPPGPSEPQSLAARRARVSACARGARSPRAGAGVNRARACARAREAREPGAWAAGGPALKQCNNSCRRYTLSHVYHHAGYSDRNSRADGGPPFSCALPGCGASTRTA